ncbi:MAG TPA: glycosyltransferase family 2 protein, partial [Pyrinomonadaceae bacterium]|nr:glycosyltransferase family 2 protein [Pyrinomonadaceae bacterium]
PCYNEEAVLRATYERLTSVVKGMNLDYELIFVNDGSHDRTQEILAELQLFDPCLRVLWLSRNFGHQVAVTAGLEEATGAAVVIIDADLQDPPEVIPEMVRLWRDGNEVVYGLRDEREGEGRFKLWTAKVFYRLINRLSETKMPLDAGDFRLLDRKVVDVVNAMPERARFLRGMVSWAGFRQVPLHYTRAPRHAGQTKYPLRKMLNFAMDGIISFSLVPLKLAIWTGFIAIWIAVGGIIVAILDWLLAQNIPRGWASLFVAVLFMGGVQLVSLGILGEYLGRIYTEVKRRPLYVVQERLGFPAGSAKETARSARVNA